MPHGLASLRASVPGLERSLAIFQGGFTMNRRYRLFLIIGIPLLLVIIVGGLYLRQLQMSTTSTSRATPAPTCHGTMTPMKLPLAWPPNTNHTGTCGARAKGC